MWDFILSLFCAIFGTCDDDECRSLTHKGAAYTVCSFQTAQVSIRLHLKDKAGKPYRRLSQLDRTLTAQKQTPTMLMNGGMYHSDLGPVGLYIENQKSVKRVSTKGGWGNFHLLPNGVFWVKNKRVGVTETNVFLKRGLKPDHATQSGPMLVISGKLHPRFLKNSDSLKIRNGVGVTADGKTVHFAISRRTVTFHEFGTLFKERLKTPNALYLDGTVSAIRASAISQGGWRELGPMISVVKR
ncbi:MAG: phosphodiester glycosidase family protein [Pseudomonadota bacterium]